MTLEKRILEEIEYQAEGGRDALRYAKERGWPTHFWEGWDKRGSAICFVISQELLPVVIQRVSQSEAGKLVDENERLKAEIRQLKKQAKELRDESSYQEALRWISMGRKVMKYIKNGGTLSFRVPTEDGKSIHLTKAIMKRLKEEQVPFDMWGDQKEKAA